MKFADIRTLLLVIISVIFLSCSGPAEKKADTANLSWSQIEQQAKGATLTMAMSMGSKNINYYMSNYAVPAMKEHYGITLNIVPGQGKTIVTSLMGEKEAGKEVGQIDLCWINGETFFQLRQIDALYGPYVQQLPNFKYVDTANPIIKYDFQQEVKGFETPWSLSSFSVIYDTARVAQKPVSMQDFETYWKQHPGKFTISNDFSGMTILKSWLIELAGGGNALDGPFDAAKYEKYSTLLWAWMNRNKQYFWKKGETFPASGTVVSQLYSSGEIDFCLSFNDAEVDNKVAEGLFPASSEAIILQSGAIQNTNYIGITANSGNKAAAMVVCNFLLSPEAQLRKANINTWGARTVLDLNKLEKEWQEKFDTLPKIKHGLTASDLNGRVIKEPDPQYMLKVFDDFRKKVIEAN
ncbi:MAG: ABC transporter substrate-binding protein [Chitinophagaceae bacterium]